jgi:hypothetical protein
MLTLVSKTDQDRSHFEQSKAVPAQGCSESAAEMTSLRFEKEKTYEKNYNNYVCSCSVRGFCDAG